MELSTAKTGGDGDGNRRTMIRPKLRMGVMTATMLVDDRILDMNARNTDGKSTTESDENLRDDEDSVRGVKNRSMGKTGKTDTESSGSV